MSRSLSACPQALPPLLPAADHACAPRRYTSDMFAARLIPGIDLIVGGHSHTFLWSNSSGPVPAYDFPNGLPSKSGSSSSNSSNSPAGNSTAGSSGSSGKGGSSKSSSRDGKSWAQQHHSKNKAKAGDDGQQVDKFDRGLSGAASTAQHGGNHTSDASRSKAAAASAARNSSSTGTGTKSIAPKSSNSSSTNSKEAASAKASKSTNTTTSSAKGPSSSTSSGSSKSSTRVPPPANATRSYSPPASSRSSSSNSTKPPGTKPSAPAASNTSSGSNSSGWVAPQGKQQQQTSSFTRSKGLAKGKGGMGADQDWVSIPGSYNSQGGKVDYVEGQYPTWVESPSENGRKVCVTCRPGQVW